MSLPPVSAYNVNVVSNYDTAEYGKFIQLTDNTSFPAVSVTKFFYPDNSQAYIPSDVKLGTLPTAVPPITSVSVYPKFATLNYVVNAADFPTPNISLSAGTVTISTSALNALTQDIDNQIISVINPAVVATEWNTYDTLTAVVAFNNNYVNTISAVPVYNKVTNWDVLTATGNNTTFTTLPASAANLITILNTTGDIMFIKNAAKSNSYPLSNNSATDIQLVGNTNEVAVRMATLTAATIYGTFVKYN